MKLIRHFNESPSVLQKGCVATIGNFDGLHAGHLQLIALLKEKSAQLGLPSLLITFEPTSAEFFSPLSPPARLMSLRDKLLALKDCELDYVFVIKFNEALSKVSAEDFITQILVKKCAIKHIIVGDDFRFGRERKGDINLLTQLGEKHNFSAQAMSTYTVDNVRVGSSVVRTLLKEGEFIKANALLKENFSINGRVVKGEQRGRKLGTPTLNISLKRRQTPLHGVYIVTVQGLCEAPCYGVANIGNRPTVYGFNTLLEVHVFNFNEVVYGKHVKVTFMEKVREEKKFDSLEDLRLQIEQDKQTALAYLVEQGLI